MVITIVHFEWLLLHLYCTVACPLRAGEVRCNALVNYDLCLDVFLFQDVFSKRAIVPKQPQRSYSDLWWVVERSQAN